MEKLFTPEELARAGRVSKEQEQEFAELRKQGMANVLDSYVSKLDGMGPDGKATVARNAAKYLSDRGLERFHRNTNACGQCFKTNPETRCGRCRKVRYCDAACQKRHWKVHKSSCFARTGFAAAGTPAPPSPIPEEAEEAAEEEAASASPAASPAAAVDAPVATAAAALAGGGNLLARHLHEAGKLGAADLDAAREAADGALRMKRKAAEVSAVAAAAAKKKKKRKKKTGDVLADALAE